MSNTIDFNKLKQDLEKSTNIYDVLAAANEAFGCYSPTKESSQVHYPLLWAYSFHLVWKDKHGNFYYDLFLDSSRHKRKSLASLPESKSGHARDFLNTVKDTIYEDFWGANIKIIDLE